MRPDVSLPALQVRELNKRLASAAGEGNGQVGSDDRQRGSITAIEADRRRELERLLLRENQLMSELGEVKKKVEAQAARIKILENDVRTKKEKLVVMLQKSDADDQLVGALRAELEKKRISSGPAGACGGFDDDAKRVQDLAARAGQQQAQIDRQEQIIIALRDQLQRQSDSSSRGGGRPSSGQRQPQDLILAQTENAKLRELVTLLQDQVNELKAKLSSAS